MLLRGTDESEDRTLTIVGALVVLLAVTVGLAAANNPFKSRPPEMISVTIDAPYAGQGVRAGTSIVMHGVEVGRVSGISSLPGGGIRIASDLQKGPVAGLTDRFKIDFRPVNYFGVTGINVVAGQGGREVRDGMQIRTVPRQNSTLQALLSRLGEVSVGALTPQLISVLDRAVQYTDGLNPLVETMMISLRAVADVQKVPTARLLANTTGVSVAFPSFTDGVFTAGNAFIADLLPVSQQDFYSDNGLLKAIDAGSTKIFGGVGRLESNYVDDLLPTIDGLKPILDTVPVLFRPADFADTLVQLRTRFEKMFAGNNEQRALQVRIVLDNLPGVAAPLGALPGPVPKDATAAALKGSIGSPEVGSR